MASQTYELLGRHSVHIHADIQGGTDSLTSHHSHTSLYYSSEVLWSHCLCQSITLLVPIHPRTTAEPFRPVWPLCQGTGTADQADHATPGSGPLNQIWHHLTLVWQLPITECRIDKHEARL